MDKYNDDGKLIISGKKKDETIIVANVSFEDCILENCKLIFGGGDFDCDDLKLINCSVEFTNEAACTISFIKLFCVKSGMDELVSIQEGPVPEPELEEETDIAKMIPISLLKQ